MYNALNLDHMACMFIGNWYNFQQYKFCWIRRYCPIMLGVYLPLRFKVSIYGFQGLIVLNLTHALIDLPIHWASI
jgi:hypothetical protein